MARAALYRHLNATAALAITAFAVYTLSILVLYALGQRGPRPVGSLARVLLVTSNAAANFVALTALGVAPAIAAAPVLVAFGAAVAPIGENRTYATVLGWTAPLLPMTWPATGVGVAAAALNYVLARLTGKGPVRFGFEPAVCAVIVYGGPLYLFRCGYNLGNLVFIHSHFVDESGTCEPGLLAHETGHTLNVAAFGFVFHYIGAVHENWGPPAGGAGEAAYAELWAESRRRSPGRPWVRGWAAAGSNTDPAA